VEEFNDKDKLVGQTYDGAWVMSGHINGLQSKVIEAYPLAIFTHCYPHVLNLVLKQSLSNIKECRLFFQTTSLSGLAAHFSKSSKIVSALQDFVAKKFLSVAPTRWNFTSRLTDSETAKKSTYRIFLAHCGEFWGMGRVKMNQKYSLLLMNLQGNQCITS
jgi:hypothetical protein